jgi:hypothetical protein
LQANLPAVVPALAESVSRALKIDFRPPSAGALCLAATLPGDVWIQLEGATLRIGTTDPSAIQGPLDQLRAAGLVVRRLQMMRPTLEDLFIEAVNDNNDGQRQMAGANTRSVVPYQRPF